MIQFVANDKEVIWGGGNGLSKDSEKDPREILGESSEAQKLRAMLAKKVVFL